jgi:hypothetical protein
VSDGSKLVQDATNEALRIREEARAEGDKKLFEADKFANEVFFFCEREATKIRMQAEADAMGQLQRQRNL